MYAEAPAWSSAWFLTPSILCEFPWGWLHCRRHETSVDFSSRVSSPRGKLDNRTLMVFELPWLLSYPPKNHLLGRTRRQEEKRGMR